VTEGLGTEIHAIFTIDAPPVEHASITSAAGRGDDEDEGFALAGCTFSTRPPTNPSGTRCPDDWRRRHRVPGLLSIGQGRQPPVVIGAWRVSAARSVE